MFSFYMMPNCPCLLLPKNVLIFCNCLQIRHGEAVGIIGPSGTGKSTILKIIAGLLAPDKVNYHFDLLVHALLLIFVKYESDYGDDQGEVFIRGKKREGLISDEEVSISGLRIGLVIFF